MLTNHLHPNAIWPFHIVVITFVLIACWAIAGVPSAQSKTLLRKMSIACRHEADCPANAFCDSQNGCFCKDGYIIITVHGQRNCYNRVEAIGDACLYDDQCKITFGAKSECFHNRCRCEDGAHFVKRANTCFESVLLDHYCKLTSNCVGEETICRDGVCRCPYDKHPRSDLKNCVPNVNLEEKCESDEECVADYSRCYDVCRCHVSHVMSKDKKRCLKIAGHIHDKCMEDQQCTERIPYSKCNDTVQACACRPGYHELKYRCWVSVTLGGMCETDENCAVFQDAICINGICACPDGMQVVDNICSTCSTIVFYQRILVLILFTVLFI